jgi:hypothetical protein
MVVRRLPDADARIARGDRGENTRSFRRGFLRAVREEMSGICDVLLKTRCPSRHSGHGEAVIRNPALDLLLSALKMDSGFHRR